MKAKHIITTCGVILGGLAVTGSASAIVTYKGSSDVQFTFSPVLSLSLSDAGFVIENLTPGSEALSNEVVVSVASNSSAGYVLKANVGNGTTYTTTDLVSSNSRFLMMSSGTKLAQGTWGYTKDNGATYAAFSTTPETIAESSSPSGDVPIKIGAYALDDQLAGTYNNVVNFSVVSNIAAHTISVVAGTNVTNVTIGSGGTINSYNEGDSVAISATCASGKTFAGWSKSADFGTIANASSASTTYTVGGADAALTAYCSE